MENLTNTDKQRLESPNVQSVPSVSLADKLHHLPPLPGVYFHKNAKGEIIYVGKAKNLKNRVRSYFQDRPMDAKTKVLVAKIADIEVIVTDSEIEALILENTLIKEHKPRYNIDLKDDKSYPYIRVTNETYPRIFSTRTIIRDGSKYFGPYTESRAMYAMMGILRSLFPLRSCSLDLQEETINKGKFTVCLDYHIKKCEGPCQNYISREQYMGYIKQALQILKGKTRYLEKEIEADMERLSEELRFEEAAVLRNRLQTLRDYNSRQKVLSADLIDRDVLAVARNEQDACSVIFKIRDGKLLARRHFYIANSDDKTEAELVQATFERFYLESDDIPDEVFLPVEVENGEILEQWLQNKRENPAHGKTSISVPQIGDKRKLVTMAFANAEFLLKELVIQRLKRGEEKDSLIPRSVLALQRDLRLNKPPRRIECFDNSHFQGSETVSSMVVFIDGKPKKSEYRKYKITTVEGIDDFKSMQEVVRRRYSRMISENSARPDLIVIDGGKGQLSHAVEILSELGLSGVDADHGDIPVIGLAKRLEEVFFPDTPEALLLPRTSSSLRLLQQVRDEAHRFAIEFHRSLRDKRTLQTELTDIEGIGEKTATKLLVAFGSVESVKNAPLEALSECVGKGNAQKLREFFATNTPESPVGSEEKL